MVGRPHRPIEHLMVAGVVALVAAAHDAQCRRHSTLTRRQDRADQQQLRFPPGWAGEQRCEGNEYGYNGIGRGEHGWTFREKWGQARLPCLYTFSKFCVKPRQGVCRYQDGHRFRHGEHPIIVQFLCALPKTTIAERQSASLERSSSTLFCILHECNLHFCCFVRCARTWA